MISFHFSRLSKCKWLCGCYNEDCWYRYCVLCMEMSRNEPINHKTSSAHWAASCNSTYISSQRLLKIVDFSRRREKSYFGYFPGVPRVHFWDNSYSVCVLYAQKQKRIRAVLWQSASLGRRRKVATSKETGSGRPHPEIIAIILACPSSCRFDTLRVVSTQNCLFDDETWEKETWKWNRSEGWYPNDKTQILS